MVSNYDAIPLFLTVVWSSCEEGKQWLLSKVATSASTACTIQPQSRFLKPQALLHSRAGGIFQFVSCVISPKSAELFAPGHHVWVGENVTARTPIFCVVLKDGEHWEVEAEWPDGTIEPVYKFKAGLEARIG